MTTLYVSRIQVERWFVTACETVIRKHRRKDVGSPHDLPPVSAERDIFYFAIARREQDGFLACGLRVKGVEMNPAVGFGEEEDLIGEGPEETGFAGCEVREDAAGLVGFGVEDGARVSLRG